jgi:hypothetical protein
MRIKAWAIDKAKGIICKDCMTCAELEGVCKTLRAKNDELVAEKNRIQDDDENIIYHWMEQYQDATVEMEKAQDRCVQLQNVIERLCQGYDAMAMAVEGMRVKK